MAVDKAEEKIAKRVVNSDDIKIIIKIVEEKFGIVLEQEPEMV
jgi:hypothetical protein